MAVEEQASVYLNFIARGTERVGAQTQEIGKRLESVGAVGNKVFGNLNAAVAGFVGGGLLGWIRSGQSATAEANRLAFAVQRIGYNIASIFTPWIEKAIRLVERLRDATENLTGAQQRQIREWVTLGVSATVLLNMLPRLVAAQAAYAAGGFVAGRAAGGQAIALRAAGARGGIMGAVGGPMNLATGLIALLSASQGGREALAGLVKAAMPLAKLFTSLSEALAPVIKGLSEFVGALLKGTEAIVGGATKVMAETGPLSMIGKLPLLTKLAGAGKLGPEELKDIFGLGDEGSTERLLQRAGILPGADEKKVLTPAAGGMESFQALYGRLAGAVTKSAAEKTEENTRGILERIDRFWQEFGRKGENEDPNRG